MGAVGTYNVSDFAAVEIGVLGRHLLANQRAILARQSRRHLLTHQVAQFVGRVQVFLGENLHAALDIVEAQSLRLADAIGEERFRCRGTDRFRIDVNVARPAEKDRLAVQQDSQAFGANLAQPEPHRSRIAQRLPLTERDRRRIEIRLLGAPELSLGHVDLELPDDVTRLAGRRGAHDHGGLNLLSAAAFDAAIGLQRTLLWP